MTEEDVKANVIIPYLSDLGFDGSDLSFEDSFSIRLGKRKYARGKSDILCKRHGKNLFVIELKNDTLPINQDDIDQGISYARLLDDIAPFTIVSNGRITRVFDSITKKELSGKISDRDTYSLGTEEEVNIRYEALKSFVSMSPENLKVFCESQVRDRMGSIVGNIDSPYSKFIEELFVMRDDLQTAFGKFRDSGHSVFGLVGQAGVGKTSALCSLALSCLKNDFVFFYNAAIIESPSACISQDLNIAFSTRTEPDTVLKRLDQLGHACDRGVIIFIDAIDENTNPRIVQEMSELAYISKDLDKIKFVISCKSNIWNSILKINDSPTHFCEELSKSHDTIGELNSNPGFHLKHFSNKELNEIIPLYRKVFDFKGELSGSVLSELRNGFFLKIFSEVYSGKQVPKAIEDKELIGKYLKKSLDQSNIGFISGTRYLIEIGKILLNHKYDGWAAYRDEGLDIYHFLERLNLSPDDNIPEDLFTRNILIKSNKEDSYNVSFYYSKIRDYIICFHSYRLDKLSNDEFYDALSDFYQNHIGQSALDFYMENASSSHIDTLVRFKKDKALEYVSAYNSYLDSNFSTFKNKFDPETDGRIGIILPKDIIGEDGYALFPLKSDWESRIAFEDLFTNDLDVELVWEKGVHSVHGSNKSLLVKDQSTLVKKNIFEQLKGIIKKGRISVYNSDILLLEQLSVILYHYHKKLGYSFNVQTFYLPRYTAIYPIDLSDLKDRIKIFKFRELYKYEFQNQKGISEAVENAIAQNLTVPEFKTTGDVPPFEELSKIVDVLMEHGYTVIEEHYLPNPDISIEETKTFHENHAKGYLELTRMFQFGENQTNLYIQEFFTKLELSYKDFVEFCFPRLKDRFSFYSTLPHEYFFYIKESESVKWSGFGYRPSRTGKVEFNFRRTDEMREACAKEGLKSIRSFRFDDVLRISYSHRPVKTVDKINTKEVDEYCLLRNWVFRFIESDLEKIFDEVRD